MRELDVLLERYLEQRYPSRPDRRTTGVRSAAGAADPQLFAYLMGREVPADPECAHVIARLTHPAP